MAGEYAKAFMGRESFAEALMDYARTLEEPMTFHDWWGMARQLQPFYDDAPARLWPNDGGEFQDLRNATFIERFGKSALEGTQATTRDGRWPWRGIL